MGSVCGLCSTLLGKTACVGTIKAALSREEGGSKRTLAREGRLRKTPESDAANMGDGIRRLPDIQLTLDVAE
jgi:hypothetical protein